MKSVGEGRRCGGKAQVTVVGTIGGLYRGVSCGARRSGCAGVLNFEIGSKKRGWERTGIGASIPMSYTKLVGSLMGKMRGKNLVSFYYVESNRG